MRALAVLLSLTAANAFAADPLYEFTIDPSATDADGRQIYLTDEEIAARIPPLGARGRRIATCVQGVTIPMFYVFTFPPSVTGPHEARTNALQCEGDEANVRLRCHAQIAHDPVVFNDDPNRYVGLGSGTNRDAALELLRAFDEGRIVYSDETKPWIRNLQVREITQDGSTFIVRKADCGCSEGVAIERRSEGAAASFVAVRKLEGFCI